ncbi:MAG: DNA internalization-related competence protein ComEC/Rec2 [Chloroflexi bacterium]|nr:DNA internalization-related competence protein ComEC/Rec2 [Chloroflexota bacterium]
MPLITLSMAWLLGMVLGTSLEAPPAMVLAGLAAAPLLLLLPRQRKAVILSGLCLSLFFAAAVYTYSSLNAAGPGQLHFYNDQGVAQVKGIVAGDPETRDRSIYLELSAAEIKTDEGWRQVEGKAKLVVPRYPAYRYGDALLVTGRLETPTSDSFDYAGYLANQGIRSFMAYPRIEVLEQGRGDPLLGWVYGLRHSLSRSLARALPEPQASLAQGIVLGIREGIPPAVKAAFAKTGAAHLLAISGLHLGIVAGMVLGASLWLLGRRYYLHIWPALATVWFYAALTGANPPVLRGAIMASLFLAAELLGRQRSAITALVFAAALMAGASPYILGDVAFQLSFLAMAGLVFLFPAFREMGRGRVRAILGEGRMTSAACVVTDSLSATLAALVFIWPVIAYYFGAVSLLSPLATLLALPVLPPTIVFGALTGAAGLLSQSLAQAAGWLSWPFLTYLLAVVEGLARLPTSVSVNPANAALLWAYYPALALFLARKRMSGPAPAAVSAVKRAVSRAPGVPKKWAIPALLLTAVFTSTIAASLPDDRLHVSILDVGQGDAIFIQHGRHQVLVDGGPSPQALALALGKKMPFWDRTIDLVVLSHPHQDHLAGLVDVLGRYRVKMALSPEIDYQSPLYQEWLGLTGSGKMESITARAGLEIDLGGAVIAVLHPGEVPLSGTASDVDNNGTVLRLSLGEVSFLLTGDIGGEAEMELVRRRASLDSTVLKVAHHGAETSTTGDFLAAVAPQAAAISAGAGNPFGHPGAGALSRLEEVIAAGQIYRTDRQGAIEFITDGQRLWVSTDKEH